MSVSPHQLTMTFCFWTAYEMNRYVALGEYDFECGQAGEGGRRECVEVGSGDCEGWRGGGVGTVVEAEKKECEEKMMQDSLE